MTDKRDLQQANLKVVRTVLLVVVGMFGFGYAMVPMYDTFCKAFGLNGQTEQVSSVSGEVDKSRLVTVTFDSNINQRLPWQFKPEVRRMQVHPGEVKKVTYLATNLSGSDIVGQAVHSVTPNEAAIHFKKTECFCYSQQPLKSGESRKMPVVFTIDPELPEGVEAVTLSYTFFRADKYASKEALEQVAD